LLIEFIQLDPKNEHRIFIPVDDPSDSGGAGWRE